MKYFFVSDLHGCRPSLLHNVLHYYGFHPEQDTLVMLGDICDRGPYTIDLVKYILDLPHTIIVKGNHDVRVEQIRCGSTPNKYDRWNGVASTLASFINLTEKPRDDFIWQYYNEFRSRAYEPEIKANLDLFDKYYYQSVWGIEFENLIAVHAWLPYTTTDNGVQLLPKSKWTSYDWNEATWSNVEKLMLAYAYPDKKMIIGHWHTWRIKAKERGMSTDQWFAQFKDGTPDFDIYQNDKLIAIDACTDLSNQINVYVYEGEDDPLVYNINEILTLSTWRKNYE